CTECRGSSTDHVSRRRARRWSGERRGRSGRLDRGASCSVQRNVNSVVKRTAGEGEVANCRGVDVVRINDKRFRLERLVLTSLAQSRLHRFQGLCNGGKAIVGSL